MVGPIVGHSRLALSDGRLLGVEDNLVDGSLCFAELAVHRPGACDVAGVAVDFTAGVNQDEFTSGNLGIVLVVVQDGGVVSTSNDARVGPLRAVVLEATLDDRLQLVFANAGVGVPHRFDVRCRGDSGRMAHLFDFRIRLDESHLAEQRARVTQVHRACSKTLPVATDFEKGGIEYFIHLRG